MLEAEWMVREQMSDREEHRPRKVESETEHCLSDWTLSLWFVMQGRWS